MFVAACATAGPRVQPETAALSRPETSSAPDEPPRAPGREIDPGATADFQGAVLKLIKGDHDGARAALESFVTRNPGHPSRATALALLGWLALSRGDASGAKAALESFTPSATDANVAFILGAAESRLGNGARALALLRPFAAAGPPSLGGMSSEDAAMLLRACLADAYASTGNMAGALEQWDHYHQLSHLRPHEKAYARLRAEELAARTSADTAIQVLRDTQASLARAVLAPKAATTLRAGGDIDGASRLDEEATRLRRSLGFDGVAAYLGPGDPTRFGLALPMSGPFHLLGEVALRGAMLAIGDPSAGGQSPFQVVVRDTARAGGNAGTSTSDLVRAEAVVGLVGVPDPRAIEQSSRDGVPFLLLDEQAPGPDTTAFQLVHSSEARAAELARRAMAAGVRTFAILGPDSAAGRRLAEAFRRAVVAGGGRVTAQATYVAGASAFTAAVAQIRKTPADAVFVPDDAEKLELVAPALAVADLFPQPWAGRRTSPPVNSKRREILLVSTARGLSKRLVKNAGRYVQGAMLAPGFYPASDDRYAATFADKYRAIYAQEPSATDAYSYDGVYLLRTAVERGARTRADVLRLITSHSFEGVTGKIRFGPDHDRADPPLVYTVDGDEIRLAP